MKLTINKKEERKEVDVGDVIFDIDDEVYYLIGQNMFDKCDFVLIALDTGEIVNYNDKLEKLVSNINYVIVNAEVLINFR